MGFRLAAKSDANQKQIVRELRAFGLDVDIISREKRLYDILVSGVPRWSDRAVGLRVEIKSEGGKLTEAEKEYWQSQRHGDNLIIAECSEQILEWFGWQTQP